MKDNSWTMTTGFLCGAVLVVLGFVLQMTVGPVAWSAFAWPVNIIALAVLLFLIAATSLSSRRLPFLRFWSTQQAAVPALVYGVVLTLIMGLTRQEPNGTWFSDMLTFWPFVLVYVYITFILGLVTLKRLRPLFRAFSLHQLAFFLNHAGLFMALVMGTLGNPDMQRLKMVATLGEKEWRGVNDQSLVVDLPITIELQRFIMETYDDGSPKRFASDVCVTSLQGDSVLGTVDVNKPLKVAGWKIYQLGYDLSAGPNSRYSILELVRDPWLPYVYAGIFMMLAGALLLFFEKSKSQQPS